MSGSVLVRGVGASYGTRVLFEGVDLTIAPGDVIGLVGPNGAGKSTLLQILAGARAPESGTVTRNPTDAHIGYLEQETERRTDESVGQFIRRRTGVSAAQLRMDSDADSFAAGAEGADMAYGDSLEAWLHLGGADLDERMQTTAAELGLTVAMDHPMTALSGGEAARVGLAALVLSRYDIYLLDEPTNDLDGLGLEQLEQFVVDTPAAVVLVSHDREFLSNTVDSVVELDRSLQRAINYGGGYDAYLEERSTTRRHAREAYEEYSARRETLQARARMQRAWMEKGVKNARRKSKDNDKIGRKFRTEATEKQASKARQSERMLERLDVVNEPRKEWNLQFTIAEASRSGELVALVRSATVRRGDFVLGPIDVQLNARDRVAITGPNGAGKSTLLALLLGRLQPDTGTAILGSGVLIGEVDQARQLLLGEEPLGITVERELPTWTTADVRTLLAKFGLGGDQVQRLAGTLSPGERTRATLALLQARGVNLLVLDEPTNHLDLPAIEQLEQALESFDGTLLLVTHDRRMLDNVRLTDRWHVDQQRVAHITAD